MKKVILLVLCAILALSFVGCDSDDKADALLKYMNEDMQPLHELEKKFHSIYNSDNRSYELLSTEGAEVFKEWSEKTEALAKDIDDENIKEVHKIYESYVAKSGEALNALTEYYKESGLADAEPANTAIEEADTLVDNYTLEIETLMKKYGLEYEED